MYKYLNILLGNNQLYWYIFNEWTSRISKSLNNYLVKNALAKE
jgi:hypothetical protein